MRSPAPNKTSEICPSRQRRFFARFGGAVRGSGGLRFSAIVGRLVNDHHRRSDEAALISKSGGEDVANLRAGGGLGLRVGQMMQLRIEDVVDGGNQRNESHTSRGIAAGILKEAHLIN